MRPITADVPVSDVRHQHRSDTKKQAGMVTCQRHPQLEKSRERGLNLLLLLLLLF